MSKKYAGLMAFGIVFVMILIPSLHVPMLSDDFYYYHAVGSSLLGQYQHYMWWSGRIVTNMISSYMMNWLPHAVYEGLTAIAFSTMLYLYACLPSVAQDRKLKPHWAAVFIVFIFYWIANPALGQTSFWFVGAANYVWPNFFVSVYLVMLLRQKEQPSVLKMAGCFVIGFLAGCSNENTCIIVILLTIAHIIYNKNLRIVAPYFVGLLTGAAVLLFSPGGAARSAVFTWWHGLSLAGKIDEQMFNRMPEAMQTYWLAYLLLIVLAICVSMFGIVNRKNVTYAAIFFVAAIMSNMAFIGAPFMPTRAYNGALCFMLISASFLIHAIVSESKSWQKACVLVTIFTFGLVYFVPSYLMFTYAVDRTWKQEQIRQYMINQQLEAGVKDISIPDHYFTRLLKATDTYPTYKQPMVKNFYKVNSFTEFPAFFDYSALDEIPSKNAGFSIDGDFILQKVYLYHERLSGKKFIIYQINDDVNKLFAQGKALFVHAKMKGKDGFVNMDTLNPAINISGSWYTYSDASDKNVELSDIESISTGIYQISPLQTISQNTVNF
ncbi:hypothetical protein BDD26_2599 [Xenorhabdus cabanillasii]|uniref:Glucosyltransferase GtrII-like protein n=1 Tax=Xenorhabdus cabanillasii TaxID=351673 RepID=A0A3D9UEF5_9GAMM|nr:DUF6056 family protein [Xenorhabdus cabanillasii]REF27779.1 hypothetical protein BDD26_2599 [Xenorhabdus cabanillasii]